MIHLPPPPVSRLIGFVLKSIEPGHAIFEMEADERHHNPMGTLHGGIYCDLADAAMGSPTPLPWRKAYRFVTRT